MKETKKKDEQKKEIKVLGDYNFFFQNKNATTEKKI